MNRGSNGSMDDDWIGTPMNPSKVRRKTTVRLTELRGMPPAGAGDETKRDVIRARHGIRIIHPTAG